MKSRRVVILGATGSIGDSALHVARQIPERMEIAGLAALRSAKKLAAAANEFRPPVLCMVDETAVAELRELLEYEPEILSGSNGLETIAAQADADMVLVAIVGTAGLLPALAALKAGKDLAVASKEILVMAGECIMSTAHAMESLVLPVDSEHNAIFQCLEGRDTAHVRRLILTASGGPFRTLPREQFPEVTVEQALRHPTWTMGRKITIDSATLFNKGLEMIEARWLFGIGMERIDVVVHPQSVVHSMVEFVDGSVLAQLSHSDMCFPIHYAVTWPQRIENGLAPLDFAKLQRLDFEAPRWQDFPALRLARAAGEAGGTLPAVYNAANEVAVDAFLGKRIRFHEIWETVARVMEAHVNTSHPSMEAILEADRSARADAQQAIAT